MTTWLLVWIMFTSLFTYLFMEVGAIDLIEAVTISAIQGAALTAVTYLVVYAVRAIT